MLRALICLSLAAALFATSCKQSDRQGPSGDSELDGLTDAKGKKAKIVNTVPLKANPDLTDDETRKAALIFYVADTAEPYMVGAVQHEIRALGEVCASQDQKVNWVMFVNSLYVNADKKVYLRCLGGKFSRVKYNIPDLDKKVAAISATDFEVNLSKDDDPRTALFDKKLALTHPKELNINYKSQPFVHPEIMKTVVTYAMTEIFNAKDYVYFLTLKGHGNAKLALTGLTAEQVEKKIKWQVEEMTKAKNDISEDLKTSDGGLKVSSDLDKKLDKLWLGQLRPRTKYQVDLYKGLAVDNGGLSPDNGGLSPDNGGLSPDNGGLSPDNGGLSPDNGGLSPDNGGLSVDNGGLSVDNGGLSVDNGGLSVDNGGLSIEDSGLGADNHFGMTIQGYFQAIRLSLDAAKAKAGKQPVLAFLNVESCETRLRGEIGDTTSILLTSMIRSYTGTINFAEGRLWYRSYDWNNILYSWLGTGGTPAKLQKALYQYGAKVINFETDPTIMTEPI